MKVYTKTGDKGETALIGGKRVPKYHPRIEAYGTVDELMSHTALLMDMLEDPQDKAFLLWVLDRLMTASSILATEEGVTKKLPVLNDTDITRIEQCIDEMGSRLEPVRSFILPGGHPAVSQCDVARTVCRRTERVVIRLGEEYPVPIRVKELLNRLSDFFFVLSRKTAVYFNVTPKEWHPIAG